MNGELAIRRPEMALQIDAEIERLLSATLTVSMVTAVMSLQQISWHSRVNPEEILLRKQKSSSFLQTSLPKPCTGSSGNHLGIVGSSPVWTRRLIKTMRQKTGTLLGTYDCRCGIKYLTNLSKYKQCKTTRHRVCRCILTPTQSTVQVLVSGKTSSLNSNSDQHKSGS